MAKICCFSGTAHVHNQFQRNHGVQSCSNSNSLNSRRTYASFRKENESESKTPQLLKIAVSGVTEFLRLFSPSSNQTSLHKQTHEFPASSVHDVLRIIQSDYDNAYFVTGRELYARNLKLLVPFFDCASIILQKIDKDVDSDTNFVLASWKLRTNLKLPWRPLISIDGSTIYELNEDYKVRLSESKCIFFCLVLLDMLRVGTFQQLKQFCRFSPLSLKTQVVEMSSVMKILDSCVTLCGHFRTESRVVKDAIGAYQFFCMTATGKLHP
ncbi:hypothetical protein CR513_11497, partial [Mucuna pruriens]